MAACDRTDREGGGLEKEIAIPRGTQSGASNSLPSKARRLKNGANLSVITKPVMDSHKKYTKNCKINF